MNGSDDEHALHNLEEERAAIQNRPHNGFTDAAHVVRLESEIAAMQERIARRKQSAV